MKRAPLDAVVRSIGSLAMTSVLTLTGVAANAATITLEANLIPALEHNPADNSTGTGQATVTLDTVADTMDVDVTFSGLTSGTAASHIHCCLASPNQTGVDVSVGTTTSTFPGFPLGVTSGTYIHSFNLLDSGTYNPANMDIFRGGSTDVAAAESTFVTALLAGETYLNIHTMNFPSGEIRGFLDPTPLPPSLILFASVLLVLGLLGWRRGSTAAAT